MVAGRIDEVISRFPIADADEQDPELLTQS
jgi:hypothetical protein